MLKNKVYRSLQDGIKTLNEIVEDIEASYGGVYSVIGKMIEDGMVSVRRIGKHNYYTVRANESMDSDDDGSISTTMRSVIGSRIAVTATDMTRVYTETTVPSWRRVLDSWVEVGLLKSTAKGTATFYYLPENESSALEKLGMSANVGIPVKEKLSELIRRHGQMTTALYAEHFGVSKSRARDVLNGAVVAGTLQKKTVDLSVPGFRQNVYFMS